MKKTEIKTTIYETDNFNDFDNEMQLLIKAAKDTVKNSYAPYSHFNVGAAVLLANGEIITGTNQENAAYPSGLCAERVALFYANSKYPDVAVKALAVTSFSNNAYSQMPTPPCGACRQVILETEIRFNKPIKIILAAESKYTLIENASSLLPLHFDDDFLKKIS